MNKCSECKHENDYIPCDTCIHSPDIKDRFEPLTNADRIRNMSDEELARFLARVENRRSAAGNGAMWNGMANALDWLKQPVKEEIK